MTEDGYDLWLRYKPLGSRAQEAYHNVGHEIVAVTSSPTLTVAVSELKRGLQGLLQTSPTTVPAVTTDASIVVGTPNSLPVIRRLDVKWHELGAEGYVIRRATIDGHAAIVIAGNSDLGALYGTFAFLRLLQT